MRPPRRPVNPDPCPTAAPGEGGRRTLLQAGYADVNDAVRLARDPAMRAIVGREGLDRPAASTSQMGRFETEWPAADPSLAALMDLSGAWIDRVHERKPPEGIILDIDGSESPTYGQQEGTAYNGHFRCTCYHPLFQAHHPHRHRASTSARSRLGGHGKEDAVLHHAADRLEAAQAHPELEAVAGAGRVPARVVLNPLPSTGAFFFLSSDPTTAALLP